LVRSVSDGFRIPKPTREADHFVAAVKRGDKSREIRLAKSAGRE
jgi:hypothetical protein